MSSFHVLVYTRLSSAELLELRKSGEQGFTNGVTVSDPLLSKINEKHHMAWMLARDLARFNDLNMTIRDHTAHKEKSLLSPAEIQADNAQVQAYAVQLATMPQESFDWLVVNAQG